MFLLEKINSLKRPLAIAHRGLSPGYVENTLAAFKKAAEIGADMIELDVRRTGDNLYISFHDETIEDKKINSLKYKEVLAISRNLGFNVPLLKDVLLFARNKILLNIEIKEEGYEKEIMDFILGILSPDEFLISSFNDSSIEKIKTILPFATTGLILGKENPPNIIRTRLSEVFPARRLKRTRADILIPHWKILRAWELRKARLFSKPVLVWTVNDPKQIEKIMKKNKVSGIITDYPGCVLSLIR